MKGRGREREGDRESGREGRSRGVGEKEGGREVERRKGGRERDC